MSATPPPPPDNKVLVEFYTSFHKHGTSNNWAQVAEATKLSIEQCEMLHMQHAPFLSIRVLKENEEALTQAFVELVNGHYNATLIRLSEQAQEEDAGHSGRANTREEEQDAHVATSGSQKPKRTPKPTPQRLAADEEQAARRLARSNQVTPKSARALQRGPPSPSAGDWSQRKRNRKLFEENGDMEGSLYRSPTADRWRGRHNTDVDEGVDALLSLASGAHVSTNLDEQPSGPDVATTTADADGGKDAHDSLHGTPSKRARGARGTRSTPTPTGTPLRNGARGSAAVAGTDSLPVRSLTGLRSPRSRAGTAAAATAAAAVAITSGRGAAASGGRSRKEQMASPTTSSQQDEGPKGASALAVADASDAGPGAPSTSEGAAGAEPAAGRSDAADAPASPLTAAGRPVRKRKPSAIAIAAAAAVEDDEGGSKSARVEVAAMAAALGQTGGLQANAPMPATVAGPIADGASGSGVAMDIATNSLLAGVPPVKTRASSRGNSSAPGSRRAAERPSPLASMPPPSSENAGEVAATAADAAPVFTVAAELLVVEPGPAADAEPSQVSQQAPAPIAKPRSLHPPPGRTRRRKSLPERLPPMWEPLPVPARAPGNAGSGDGAMASAGADTASSAACVAPLDADIAAAVAGKSESAVGGEGAAAMPALEVALRHSLGPRMRRWCMYEFLYSAIDRPWFMRNELLEFCLHMQLPTTKLTRLEWSVLRSALGRPRRLSLAFLREERLRLEGYREHARLKYEEVAHGFEVPPELPRQLRVGQEVAARHPGSQQLYDGVILTVKGSKYRVQFHRSDLMTEVIRDTDVMPLDPHECMPLHVVVVPLLLNGRPYDSIRLAELRGLMPPPAMRPQVVNARPLGSWAMGLDTQLMRDQDAAMVQEVQRALEVKENLVARLTQLNSEAASGLHAADDSGNRSEHFQLQYTNVVLQLKETNAVLEAALSRLQTRQQQVVTSSSATFGPALALQQQQQAAATGPGPGMGARASGPLSHAQQQPIAQSPQAPQALTPQAPLPFPSPTAPIAMVMSGHQPSGRGKTPGPTSLSQHAPPLIIPPPRGSTASAASTAPAPQAFGLPLLMPSVTSEQLLNQAFAEARAVVNVCRGKTTEPMPPLLVIAPSVVAPILAMQVQAPHGGAVPLVLPTGAVLSQQSTGRVGAQPQASATVGATDAQQAAAAGGDATVCPSTEAAVAAGVSSVAAGQEPGATAAESPGPPVRIKTENGVLIDLPSAAAATARAMAELQALSEVPAPSARPLTEEEVSESWLRDVIVGCVGVLFTIQKCTAGNVPAVTVADALDLAVQHLQIKTDGENEALYRDIVQSVQGLKGYLTRAIA